MRLSFKIALAFVVGMGVILSVSGILTVRREAALIEDDTGATAPRSRLWGAGRPIMTGSWRSWRIQGPSSERWVELG